MNTIGCELLEHGIAFEPNSVCDCEIQHGKELKLGKPILIANYNGEQIDWEALFEIKKNRVAKQKISTNECCEGCYALKEYKFSDTNCISYIAFGHMKLCNSRCVYCSDSHRAVAGYYDVLPIIKDLIDKDLFKNSGEVTIQGGEPTLMHNFDELLNLFIDQKTRVRIHSSGIIMSNSIKDGIEKGLVTVVISVDSGVSETYKKIKNVDKFQEVCKTIKEYSSVVNKSNDRNLILKYIIVPGYNDTIKDIDAWFSLVDTYSVKTIAMDIDAVYADKNKQSNVSPHVHLLMDYISYKSQLNSLNLITYGFATYVIKSRKFVSLPIIIRFRALYSLVVNLLKYFNRSKNRQY